MQEVSETDPCGPSEVVFLEVTSERADLNQYWFSRDTITTFVKEVVEFGGRAALVSSPSVYFSLPADTRSFCKVLDYDRQWDADPGFVFYDFNAPEELPVEMHASFDFVLVDPPFITREVWEKYAITTRLLARQGGRILCTTIAENASMMLELLALRPARYRPSIPNLVYQYSVYTNYSSDRLNLLNPEIDDEDWMQLSSASLTTNVHCERPIKTSSSSQQPFCSFDDGRSESKDSEPIVQSAEVLLLLQFRELVVELKRAIEAMQAPLQSAVRRRSVGGEAGTTAAAKAASALDNTDAAATKLAAWIAEYGAEVSALMGDTGACMATSIEQDKLHTRAVSELVARARGGALSSMAAYKDFALACKPLSGSLFRFSGVILDRVKILKRSQVPVAVGGS